MAANKPNSRNWNDVQLVIVSFALVLTLILWNSFASPDRVRAQSKSSTVAAAAETAVVAMPSELPQVNYFLGARAPGSWSAPVAVAPAKKPRNGGGGGGGGGGNGGGTGGS
jgi:uncharacterized membrane protein YgcG